jgi:hypothetical protein
MSEVRREGCEEDGLFFQLRLFARRPFTVLFRGAQRRHLRGLLLLNRQFA